jgi:hypothetical protein
LEVVGTGVFPLSLLERGLKSFSVSGFPNSWGVVGGGWGL